MQFVRTHEILRHLRDFSVGSWRQQFRRDGGVGNVEQGPARSIVGRRGRKISYKMRYKGFWHACVHSVHRHMVAVVCGPSESELGKVAGAQHHASALVGYVHEYLCAFACL